MSTKVFVFLALTTIAYANDVIVGLKTDGKKFFDENRQANPALWRQMDNVTIKAPENEVIRRVVITDLRPDKDGDAKVVEGGEGQKNVTIELKSPTVLRGYEFHIEVYSTPEQNVPFTNDQQSTTEIVQDPSTEGTSTNPISNLDPTSKLPDQSTDKLVPAVLSNDEVTDSEREGRSAKNGDNITSEGTTEPSSTTLKSDVSTTTTLNTEGVTENRSEQSSDTPNKFENYSTISPFPLNKDSNFNPIVPAIIGKDDKNVKGNEEIRHVRDTEMEMSGKSAEVKLNTNPKNVGLESSTKNDKEATTTEKLDAIPVEEKSEDKDEKDVTTPQSIYFNNRKYTSFISSKVEQPASPINGKDETLRNVRDANEQEKIDESVSTTTTPGESTTTEVNDESTTISSDDCVTTDPTNVQNPVDIGKDGAKIDPTPIYLNDRQWNQRFNNPTFQRDGQNAPGLKLYPATLTSEQSPYEPETMDAERLGNDSESSPDHMENRNPKISAIAYQQHRDMVPVIPTQ